MAKGTTKYAGQSRYKQRRTRKKLSGDMARFLAYLILAVAMLGFSVYALVAEAGWAVVGVCLAVSLWIGYYAARAWRWQRPQALLQRYLPQFSGRQNIPLSTLARLTNSGKYFVRQDVKVLLKHGLLPGARLDEATDVLYLSKRVKD